MTDVGGHEHLLIRLQEHAEHHNGARVHGTDRYKELRVDDGTPPVL